jgi:hypothetical protein
LPILHLFFVGMAAQVYPCSSAAILIGHHFNSPATAMPSSIIDYHDEQHLVQPTQLKTMLQLLHH